MATSIVSGPLPKVKPWYRGRVGVAAGVILVVLVLASLARPKPDPVATATAAPTATLAPVTTPSFLISAPPTVLPAPTLIPTAIPPAPPISYTTLTARQWAKIVKAPDNYIGKGYKVWGCIWQFDARTGPDSFLATASYHKLTYWYTDGDDGSFESLGVDLSDIVQNDVVFMNVIVLGSYTYDTAAGGTNTVPSFAITAIARKGSC